MARISQLTDYERHGRRGGNMNFQDRIREQGLTRVVAVCCANGAEGEVEETGGGVLVLYLNRGSDAVRVGVTCPEKSGRYLVVRYPNPDDEGIYDVLEEKASIARVGQIARAFAGGHF
jgi:hypothetical protein